MFRVGLIETEDFCGLCPHVCRHGIVGGTGRSLGDDARPCFEVVGVFLPKRLFRYAPVRVEEIHGFVINIDGTCIGEFEGRLCQELDDISAVMLFGEGEYEIQQVDI